MEIIGKQIRDEKSEVTVKFVGEGGDIVSVHMKKDDSGNLNRLNAEEKAKAVMVQIATFDNDFEAANEDSPEHVISGGEPSKPASEFTDEDDLSPAAVSLRSASAAQDGSTLVAHLDKGFVSSFPASEPVSATIGASQSGRPNHPNANTE